MNESWKKYFKGDSVIWAVIISLSIISLLAVYSSTGTLAYKYQHGNTAYYVLKHFTFLFIGLIIIFGTHLVPYKIYSRLSQLFLLLSIPLLAITLVFGRHLNDASRWLTLPGLGFSFQTSDFAKLALIMFVARQLSLKQDSIKDFKKTFLPVIGWVALICILILPANFSTAAILFISSIILMFIGRISLRHLFVFTGSGILLTGLFIIIAHFAFHYQGRIETWKTRVENFVSSKTEENFQVEQSKIAIATGGIIGKGPGNSVQRNFLPHPYSDFIYSVIIEEYGLIGGVVVLFFYLWLLFRAGIMVRKMDSTFPAFLAIGLTLILVFQAMVNMAVAVNILPVTGQPLPLVSMGGSSMLFSCFALGIILNISRGKKNQSISQNEENPEKEITDDNGTK
jgi:cell division protein FtsW